MKPLLFPPKIPLVEPLSQAIFIALAPNAIPKRPVTMGGAMGTLGWIA